MMPYIKILFLIVIIFAIKNLQAQDFEDRMVLGRVYAEQELKKALSNEKGFNYADHKRVLIKDSLTAINIVEPFLFGIYGKETIIDERPYETYRIGNYWVIIGTLPKNSVGGTFLIVMDARDCQVIRLTHGK